MVTIPKIPPNGLTVFQQANEAYEGIISAGSLQEYATAHPETTIQETDFFSQLTVPATLDKSQTVQDKVFSLKAGELSSLIESPTGYTILFAESIQEPEVPPLDAVKKQVSDDYRAIQAKKLARDKSEEILTALQSGTSLPELGKTNNIPSKEAKLSRSAMGMKQTTSHQA